MATVEYTGPLEGQVTFHGHQFSKGSPAVEMSDAEAEWFKGRQHFIVDGAALAEQPDEDIPEEDVRVLARETRDTLDAEAETLGLDPDDYSTKTDIARAIIAARPDDQDAP